MPVLNRIAAYAEEMKGWRHHLHANPELAFECHNTAAYIVERLKEIGVDEIHPGIAKTGIVAIINGSAPGDTIGLRADMDALPIVEITGADHASTIRGKMHACGHDGHTAMLLGAAKYLAETRNFDGTVVCIFQPAEEGGGGGKVMVEDGLITRWNIDEVYGMHNMPGIPVGHFAIRPGAMMAAADQFEIVVTGKGGHAAKPHDCIDTTLVSAHIIVALQTIASRIVDPLKQVVVSVCTVATDSTAHNVIPQVVTMKGTVRTMDPKVQDLVEARMAEIVEGTAKALGAKAEFRYHRGYPVTVNAEANTGFAADVARAVSGQVDTDTAPLMGAEDFSYMLNERPGAYIFLGNGDTAMVHHPAYNVDDDALPFDTTW